MKQAAVIELTPDAVAVTGVGADDLGVPRRLGPQWTWNWSDLLPGLPSAQDSQWLRLAGGIGVHGGGRVTRIVTVGYDGWPAVFQPLRDVLVTIDPSSAVVLVRQVAGWPMVDDGLRVLTDHLVRSGMADGHEVVAAVTETLDELLRRAPLRHGYALALAEVDRATRRVRLVTHPLFDANTVVPPEPEMAPESEVTVVAPPTRSDDLALAIVAPVEDNPRQWRPVVLAQCAPPPGTAVRVRVALDGPGRVRFLHPKDLRTGGTTWPGVLDGVPDEFGAEPVDVIFALELSGTQDAVAARCQLVADLLALIETDHPDPAAVMVGLIGYDDHDLLDWRRSQLSVVRSAAPVAAAGVLTVLRGWRPSAPRCDFAAPVEDALHALNGSAGMRWWRNGAARYLVTVGARPPHPARQEDDLTVPCPARRDWRTEMNQLVVRDGVRRVAVRGAPEIAPARAGGSAQRRADTAWRQLGADALFAMDSVSASGLASALGLLAGYGERVLPVPLAGPAAGSTRGVGPDGVTEAPGGAAW
ncbi:hypothetical protein FDG2_6397 [Candidatus Protofrankia californiensis]|uniref:Uncharacterized protein n=1 Tax=Candidatus Protofrankia californiensis TaxID=1839754 RepID=A0A1C3PH02_9ACTN|nr:hypothetical protein FDG2_6397 [Candidatus Protofrankia californiensis]